MNYALSNNLSSNVSGIDSDARLYIAAVEAVLPGNNIATALPNAVNPKRIISDFIKSEKAASRWTLHKRIYLPIYANSAANAICMKSLTSGTFVNLPTMGAGFVKGNASNQYFNINTTLGDLGITSSDGSCIIGLKAECTVANRGNHGALSGSGYNVDFRTLTGLGRRMTWLQSDTSVSGVFDTSQKTGVIVTTRTSASQYTIHNDSSDLGAVIFASGVPSVNPFVMARNNNGTPDLFGDSEIAFIGFGLGLSAANARGYASSKKNLWQNLTGLTLP